MQVGGLSEWSSEVQAEFNQVLADAAGVGADAVTSTVSEASRVHTFVLSLIGVTTSTHCRLVVLLRSVLVSRFLWQGVSTTAYFSGNRSQLSVNALHVGNGNYCRWEIFRSQPTCRNLS
jgi:hypothetical protein